MTRFRWFQVAALLAIIVFFVCGQPALAQHHLQVRVVRGMGGNGLVAEQPLLQQLSSGFGVLAPPDANGGDSWPCFGGFGFPDCADILAGGVVIGMPAYTQSLAACDANFLGAPNCGQIFWFYEDDTGDNTDHLIISIRVKQGLNYILGLGPIDLGPNPHSPGSVIMFFADTAFGTLGQPGPNNGFCGGSGLTCVNPHAGVANVTITTQVGVSIITSKFKMFLK